MSRPIASYNNQIKWTVDKFSSLDENMRYSDVFDFQGVKWNISIKKTNNKTDVFINCLVDENEKGWICRANAKLTMFSHGETINHFIEELKNKLLNHDQKLLSTKPPINNRHICDDSVTFCVDLDFVFYNFSKSIPNYTDIIVKVEDVDLHFSKGELCLNSKYFHDLFITKNSEETKIQLENTVLKDFLLLLTTMYPTTLVTSTMMIDNQFCSSPSDYISSSIFEFHTQNLLSLADQLQFHTFHMRIATGMLTILEYRNFYTIGSEDSDYLMRCIKFGDKYGYPELVDIAIRGIKTPQEIKNMAQYSMFESLEKATRKKIFNRLLKLL